VAEIDLAEEHRGPSLLQVAIVHAGLFLVATLATTFGGGVAIPSPFAPRGLSDEYFAAHPLAVQVRSFFQLGAAIPLAVFTAAIASRLRFLGMRVAGVHIALVGGLLASVFQAAAACAYWVVSQPGVSEIPAVTRPLYLFAFAAGGPSCLAGFGLLVAGVSVVAGLAGLLPRWLMLFGLAIAAVDELCVFTFVAPFLRYPLAVARLLDLAWMICAGALLPKARPVALPPA
jgi:hypothetical protein